MNNKFIPIISVFMTISLIVFVALQFYWLKGYYGALEQDFSNKIYAAMESSAGKVNKLEVEKYYAKYPNFKENILKNSSSDPNLRLIQSIEDSANKRQISYSQSILEKKDIPISNSGDSLKIATVHNDEAIINIKKDENTPEALTSDVSSSLESGEYFTTEFAKLVISSLPITELADSKTLDSIVHKELKVRGIDTKFGLAVTDKENKLTSIVNDVFKNDEMGNQYSYPLFTDKDDRTIYSLALTFPRKDYSLAKNNLPMLLGTFLSLLTILGIYIISLNYMLKQKKISEVKTDFINNMSHEFKTPLATISVATDSLANDKIATNPEKVKYYSGLIKQENLRMKKQVENVLNMSKLERNEVKLFLKETNVRNLIEEITSSFNIIVNQREGNLTKEFNAQKYEFKIDEFHLSNALVNLLDNANKYSPEKPEIKISTKNEGHLYVIEIADQGMGMETENKKKIFEKFFREETGNIHNVKGQGLGLSYVKKIIDLHHGTIHVESQKGKGSSFTIKLPMS